MSPLNNRTCRCRLTLSTLVVAFAVVAFAATAHAQPQSPAAPSATPAPASTTACGAAAGADGRGMPCRIETSIFAAPEAPSLFPEVKVRSTDLLEASLSVESRGASLTYAPFLYGLTSYKPLISEMRLRLSQTNSLTTFGIGTQYNPLSPRGARGTREWLALGGTKPPLETLRLKLHQQRTALEESLKPLLEEYRLVSTFKPGMTAEDLKAMQQKQGPLIEKITEVQAKLVPIVTQITALEATERKATSDRLQTYYMRLLDTRTPIVGFGYNATTFALLGGSDQDADNDGLNDVEHRLKKHSLSASVDLRLSERFQIGGLVTREWDRGSAEDGTEFASMTGFSFTAGGIVAVLDADYKQSAAYRESLFIPSVVLGGSIEYRHCGNATQRGVICPDRLERVTALTPFVDLRVTKTTQFRIGVPFKFSEPVTGSSGVDLGVVTAFTLQLGEPK